MIAMNYGRKEGGVIECHIDIDYVYLNGPLIEGAI